MNRSSKNRLTEKETFLFPGDNLFDKIARTVCKAGCLPRKELFESWEVARRTRRRFRGGRIVDLACGHGLTAMILLLLDDTSSHAIAVDQKLPPSAQKLCRTILREWPRLAGRIEFRESPLQSTHLSPEDLVVSVHACGDLTDLVMNQAMSARARFAVLPCCHNLSGADTGNLDGWIDKALAMDVRRASRCLQNDYQVFTQTIPSDITPKNRLLLAEPKK